MNSLNILIADDESLIRMDLCQMLEEAGHNVVAEAANGQKALELAEQLYPDLIIMDIKMPKLDGLQVAEKIFSRRLAPVLLLTAYSQQEFVQTASAAGVMGYLVKPIRDEQLFPAIEIALSRFNDLEALKNQVNNLEETLATRKLIARAKGILMDIYKINEQDAYRKMQLYSMDKRKNIREVAQGIIKKYEQKK